MNIKRKDSSTTLGTTRWRNLLAVILTALLAVLFVLAAVPFISKTSKTANADSEVVEEAIDKNALAKAVGYDNYEAMNVAISSGTTLNASNFRSYTITFGGMTWYPVLTSVEAGEIILTLWLEKSIGSYTFSDGTYANSSVPQPSCNDYQYSWIRSAINMGQTSDNGDYYGLWNGNNQPTLFHKDEAPNETHVAPEDFDAFSSIVGNKFVVEGGPNSDYLWIPTMSDLQDWSCLGTQQWGSNIMLRDKNIVSNSYYRVCVTFNNTFGSLDVYTAATVRPAININLSKVSDIPDKPDEDTTEFTYTGSALTYNPVDFNEETMEIEGRVQSNAGTYTVTVTPKCGIWSDGDKESVEFTFTINKAKPKLDESGIEKSYDSTSGMPDLSSLMVNSVSGITVAGTFSYENDPTPTAGETSEYTWIFTPTDIDNYEVATGTITLTFEEQPEESEDPNNPGGGGTTDPTDPSNPGGTTDPTDPSNPGGTTDPTDPSNPGGTTDPTDPSNPGGTTDPTDPSNPGGTTDPTDPSNPGGTTDPTDPSNPGGGGTTDPTDPSNPGGTTDPTDPNNPGGSGSTTPTDPYPELKTDETDGLKLLPVPDLGTVTYNGNNLDILQIRNWIYTGLVTLDGNVYKNADTYQITLVINNPDLYKWDTSSLKALTRYSLTVDYVGGYSVDGATLTASWEIAPAVIHGTWGGGTLTLSSDSYKGSYDGVINYHYFDSNGNEVAKPVAGETYTVTAELADTQNFVFDQETEELLEKEHTYTKEYSFGQKLLNFLKKNWWWLLIALAALILLIVIIVVASRRRKDDDKKKAKKEERAIREEEQIRALQAAPVAAGVIAAQPVVQPVAQPVVAAQPQPIYVNGGADNSQLISELRAEVAELRAENRAAQQPVVAQPVQQYAPQPFDGNVLARIEAELARLDAKIETRQQPASESARIESVLARMEAERSASEKTELEILKMKLEEHRLAELKGQLYAPQFNNQQPRNPEMEKIVTFATALWQSMNQPVPAAQTPAQENAQGDQPACPPGAIMTTTTTTTVDASAKDKAARAARFANKDNRPAFEDIDGFYDSIDESEL